MKRGLLTGRFDPPTLGHLEIIERASGLFGELYIAVFDAKGPGIFLSVEERMEMLTLSVKMLNNVTIMRFSGLAIEFAVKTGSDYLVRGIRNANDFVFEYQMASMNRKLSGIDTIFLLAAPEYSHINASLVREVGMNGKSVEDFVPKVIVPFLSKKLLNNN